MANKNLKFYILTNEADSDLDEIFDYTEDEHGFDQAVKYLSDLENMFAQLVKYPNLGRERKEIKKGIFSFAEQLHTVVYQIEKDHLIMVRVLDGKKDIPKLL